MPASSSASSRLRRSSRFKKNLRDPRDSAESTGERQERLIRAVGQLGAEVSIVTACQALEVTRATYYRRRCEPKRELRARPKPPRSLTPTEQQQVLDVLHTERFIDKAPTQVYATLLDEGTYLCSTRTMYRILAAKHEVRERRDQLRHPQYRKPELLATGPNQVWSWDITKLLGPEKWSYYYLYVILDIFSRYVVGWVVAERESAELAQHLICETIQKQRIPPGQLTIHADRGAAMRSKPVAFLLADMGITKTHSRPHTSDDNPYSEAQFKTLKYRPDFPDRFGSLVDARAFCRGFFTWYNQEHRHSGIGLLTPHMMHHGQAEQVHEQRTNVLLGAYTAHPERFVNRPPTPPAVPTAAWINRPAPVEDDLAIVP